MKNKFLAVLIVVALGASALSMISPLSEPTLGVLTAPDVSVSKYQVIPAESNITWIGRKITGEHTGRITLESGILLVNRTVLRGGTFIMDMRTITCTDLTDAKSNGNLVSHLKSDDFFSVDINPTAMFAITNLAPRQNSKSGAANYIITGDLTIKGISNQISFPMYVSVRKGVATAKGTLKFDRTKWGIEYRSGNFIENLGDKTILDDVELQLEIVAKEEKKPKK